MGEFVETMLAPDPCKQGYKDRLFLAYYAGGRIGARQEM